MDDSAQDTGETDPFARLLAQLSESTAEQVATPAMPVATPHDAEATNPEPEAARQATPQSHSAHTRAPELMGADELAAPPRPFPPVPIAATPLIAPPPPAPAVVAPPVTSTSLAGLPAPAGSPQLPQEQTRMVVPTDPGAPPIVAAATPATPPSLALAATAAEPAEPAVPADVAPAASDFAALLLASPSSAPAPVAASPAGGGSNAPVEHDIGKSTVGEKLILPLAILLPPLGLVVGIVAAIVSARRRGWVIGLLRASIAIGIVLSVVLGIGAYIGFTMLKQQQAHDRTEAASVAFCSAIKADPTMIQSPDFGWPAVAATITDSLTAMQAYEDRWTKLAKLSPAGIKGEVTKVVTAAKQIIDSVTVARTVDDASNISIMTQTASASGVPAWYSEYCT